MGQISFFLNLLESFRFHNFSVSYITAEIWYTESQAKSSSPLSFWTMFFKVSFDFKSVFPLSSIFVFGKKSYVIFDLLSLSHCHPESIPLAVNAHTFGYALSPPPHEQCGQASVVVLGILPLTATIAPTKHDLANS